MTHLKINHGKWDLLLQQELAEETKTEISETEDNAMEDLNMNAAENSMESSGRRYSLPFVMLETVDKAGRRHSVPLNLSKHNTASSSFHGRRESISASGERHKLVIDSFPHLEEEDEELDISFKSSCSGSVQKSSNCGSVEERPVSAENLLPEPSIATITTSVEATRLSNVLHGNTMLTPPVSKTLMRQQTFPPIQIFARTRYMSTAGEIVALTSASNSSSTYFSRNELNTSVKTGSSESAFSENLNFKRSSSSSESDREKNKTQKCREKENINPQERYQECTQHHSLQEVGNDGKQYDGFVDSFFSIFIYSLTRFGL